MKLELGNRALGGKWSNPGLCLQDRLGTRVDKAFSHDEEMDIHRQMRTLGPRFAWHARNLLYCWRVAGETPIRA
jgi:hypothetical protein